MKQIKPPTSPLPPSPKTRIRRRFPYYVHEDDDFGFMGCYLGNRRYYNQDNCFKVLHATPYVDVRAHGKIAFDGIPIIRDGKQYVRRVGFVEAVDATFYQSQFGVIHDDTQLEEDGSIRDDLVAVRVGTIGSQHETFYAACAQLLRADAPPQAVDPAYWLLRQHFEECAHGCAVERGHFYGCMDEKLPGLFENRPPFAQRYTGPLRLNPAEGDLP